VVEKILTEHYGVTRDAAGVAASLSRGDIRRAKELAADFDDEGRQWVFGLISDMPEAPDSWVVERAVAIARHTNRESAARFLDDLAVAFRDVMAGDPSLFVNRDKTKVLQAQIPRWNRKNLPRILDRIVGARDGVLRRNLNIEAAMVDLFLDIQRLR
jgi:hypothetical protein